MNNLRDATAALTEKIMLDNGYPISLCDLETASVQIIRQVLQHWLESREDPDPEPRTRCRDCGNFANYVSKRAGFIRTRFGLMRYKRAYYVCPHCHQSTCPLDERLNPIESLARMRTKIAAGKALPVAELAKAWGLGRMKPSASDRLLDIEYLQRDFQLPGSTWEQPHPHQPQDRIDPISEDSVQTEMLIRPI